MNSQSTSDSCPSGAKTLNNENLLEINLGSCHDPWSCQTPDMKYWRCLLSYSDDERQRHKKFQEECFNVYMDPLGNILSLLRSLVTSRNSRPLDDLCYWYLDFCDDHLSQRPNNKKQGTNPGRKCATVWRGQNCNRNAPKVEKLFHGSKRVAQRVKKGFIIGA